MSKSRSTTPTPDPSSTVNIAPPSDSTTSRNLTYDQDYSPRPISEPLQPTPRSTATTSHSFDPPSSPLTSSAKRSPPTPNQPMAKRLRGESPDTRRPPTNHSSPSSDSQDDMADNEMDAGKSEHSEPNPQPTAPTKKKRTRTLTTPAQSQVLHALLAQSRFPTTAMREEVGRTIGLSARKVQIWFQNQRQKARRPRTQGEATANRPPQYGAFLSSSTSGTMGSFSVVPEPMGEAGPSQASSYSTGPSFYARPGENYSGYSSAEAYNSSVESPTRLLGPGMPGESHPAPPYRTYGREAHAPMSAPPTERGFPGPFALIGGSTGAPQPQHRPSTSQPRLIHERDASRTLPPLPATRPMTSSSLGSHRTGASMYSGPTSAAQFPSLRSTSPELRFAHHPPGSPVVLPPPFTLQPQPQWDDDTFPSLPRPGSSAWSRAGSHSTGGRPSPPASLARDLGTTIEHSHAGETGQRPSTDVPASRHGRYDPVRAMFVPMPSKEPGEHDETETGNP